MFGSIWLSIPDLLLAVDGFDEMLKAYDGLPSRYEIPAVGHRLFFERQMNRIRIYSTLNNCTDSVDASELLNVFNLFVMNVKRWVSDEIPEILEKNYWREWLKN